MRRYTEGQRSHERGLDRATVHDALQGDRRAMRELLAVAGPIVRARAARVARAGAPSRSAVLHDFDDLCQEVFAALFENDAKVLRDWDPARGLSFRNFIGLVAQRRMANLRARSCESAFHELPFSELTEYHARDQSLENRVASRQLLERMWRGLQKTLSARGQYLFERLYVFDQPDIEVRSESGLTSKALYRWRHRLRGMARNELSLVIEDERRFGVADEPLPVVPNSMKDPERVA